jgi:hypothetical protein
MITFLRKFRIPDREFLGKPFWSWNGELKARELVRQVRVLKRMGFGGFFMPARVGMDGCVASQALPEGEGDALSSRRSEAHLK